MGFVGTTTAFVRPPRASLLQTRLVVRRQCSFCRASADRCATRVQVLPCAFVLVVSSPILLCMLSPANEKNDGERGQHKIVVDSGIFTWGACF
eukprot:3326427-Prymnesium_polylepis.2